LSLPAEQLSTALLYETPTLFLDPYGAQFTDVVAKYGRRNPTFALNGASGTIKPGVITGLIGRNGAGKSTLMQTLAGMTKPTSGLVLVGPVTAMQPPWENIAVTAGMQLVRESGDVILGGSYLSTTLKTYARMRPTWDAGYAARLIEQFELPLRKDPRKLSRGQQSALGAVIGLASRAPLTIFDEVTLGMDAPTRKMFYDEVITDYANNPRTIVFSTHLVTEAERLFEDIIVVDRGVIAFSGSADNFRQSGYTLNGPAKAIEPLLPGKTVLARSNFGSFSSVTIDGQVDLEIEFAAESAGVEIGQVGLADYFELLTANWQPQLRTIGNRRSGVQ